MQPGHAWLTQHYKWALDRIFIERNHSHAIILEDDMLLSEDFLTYFAAAAPLLKQDPTIWCISTWNDNGLAHLDWTNDKLVCESQHCELNVFRNAPVVQLLVVNQQ